MQINTIQNNNSTSFGKIIKLNEVESALFTRNSNPGRYTKYIEKVESQMNNNIDILLDTDKSNRLIAIFRSQNGLMLKVKENYLRALFNCSPIKFIQEMCKMADEFNAEYINKIS